VDATVGNDSPFADIVAGCINKFDRDYTWTATDQCGNSVTTEAVTATVSDTEGPTLACTGAESTKTFDLCAGGTYPAGYTTVMKADDCDGTSEVTIESAPDLLHGCSPCCRDEDLELQGQLRQ
jgi:hypothetical protein